MLRSLLLLLLFFMGISSGTMAQIIWSEDFSGYADGTATGANNNTTNPSSDWTSVCPGSVAATDYYHVVGGQLQGRDTNGPATFETEVIDISSCSGEVSYSIDFSESGTLEGCTAGCGCNCVDWVQLEVSVDGGAYTSVTSAQGGPCTQGCSGGDYLLLDDFGNFSYTSPCFVGSTLQLRISVQTWAGTELINIDNIVVECGAGSCILLPVEIDNFDGKIVENGHLLQWGTSTEINNDYFELQHSSDGVNFYTLTRLPGAGNSTESHHYQYLDEQPQQGYNYYRLKTVDFDGNLHYSKVIVLENEKYHHSEGIRIFPNPVGQQQATIQLTTVLTTSAELQIIDMLGRVVHRSPLKEGSQKWVLPGFDLKAGAYLLQIQTADGQYYQKQFVK